MLVQVTQARASANQVKVDASTLTDPAAFQRYQQSQDQLSGVLGRLMAISEKYPDLKSDQNFLALQEELTATEGRVAYARQFYNDSVLGYNNKLQAFPTVFFAKALKFERREYFETDEAARQVPKVEF